MLLAFWVTVIINEHFFFLIVWSKLVSIFTHHHLTLVVFFVDLALKLSEVKWWIEAVHTNRIIDLEIILEIHISFADIDHVIILNIVPEVGFIIEVSILNLEILIKLCVCFLLFVLKLWRAIYCRWILAFSFVVISSFVEITAWNTLKLGIDSSHVFHVLIVSLFVIGVFVLALDLPDAICVGLNIFLCKFGVLISPEVWLNVGHFLLDRKKVKEFDQHSHNWPKIWGILSVDWASCPEVEENDYKIETET